MARKSTTAKKKRTSTGKKTTSKAKKSSRKSTSSNPRSKSSRSTKASASKKSSQTKKEKMSLDRKLDIIGIALVSIGLLTFLVMISPIKSGITQGWMMVLGWMFGGGKYLFPFLLFFGGLWLILRKFENIPPLEGERVIGFALLFIGLLAILHFLFTTFMRSGEDAFRLANDGLGGGYLGAAISAGLEAALGVAGTGILLVAWLIIALLFAFNITVWDMFSWFPRYNTQLQDWIIEKSADLRNRTGSKQQPTAYYPTVPKNQTVEASKTQSGTLSLSGPALDQFKSDEHVWELPPISQILESSQSLKIDESIDLERAQLIEDTIASFGAPGRVVEINRGPTITQFGVEPTFVETRSGRTRVRVGKIASLADDLALALSARTIRIQAPVPGKGYIGIEVPNDEISLVALRDVLESQAFKRLKSPLRFALGQNVAGNAMAADLASMPHLLIAGATGSGKSVCVNSLICCLLINNTPDDLRLVMVDPKRVELTAYNGVPHLLAPVVVDLEKVVSALQWILREMDMRYRKLAEAGCRNIKEYNAKIASNDNTIKGEKLPYLVVIIDELSDLMMLAPDETERSITRLAQLARATGIHMIIATQRPSVDVVTGLIKANFPARIAFAVASGVDSRVILDQPGAERLLGRGDMLFQAPDAPAPIRLQGVFVSDNEIFNLTNYWRAFAGLAQPAPTAVGGVVDGVPSSIPLKQMSFWEENAPKKPDDPLFDESVDLVRRQGRASISMLQRRLRIGYTRAARLIEDMEERGIIGAPDPKTGGREVLDYGPTAPPEDV